MSGFKIVLRDSVHGETIEGVSDFIGEDASGSFGLRARHARLMTTLVFGLARFRVAGQAWQYLAVPGALVYFADNTLMLSTRRYLLDDNYERISTALMQQLLQEEEALHATKHSLHRLETEMLRRMWELRREPGMMQ